MRVTDEKGIELVEESFLPEEMEVLEPELLSPLQEVAGRELVLTFEGKVQRNDITPKFKEDVRLALAGINLNLVDDKDFEIAANDIKACEVVEKNLKQLLNDVTAKNKDIAEARTTIEKMIFDFAGSRKTLKTKVSTRKKEKVQEIIKAGVKSVTDKKLISPVLQFFTVDIPAIEAAVKNKKKYSAMEVSVDAVVKAEIARLTAMEVTYLTNITAIDQCLIDNPLLSWPDKETTALQPTENVALMITARVNEHKLAVAKKKADDAAAKIVEDARIAKVAADKAEADRQSKLKAEQEAEDQRKLAASIPEPTTAEPQPEPPPVTASTTEPPAKETTSVAPPNWGETPTIAANPFTDATFTEPQPEPQKEETVYFLVAVDAVAIQEVTVWIKGLEGLEGVVSVRPYYLT